MRTGGRGAEEDGWGRNLENEESSFPNTADSARHFENKRCCDSAAAAAAATPLRTPEHTRARARAAILRGPEQQPEAHQGLPAPPADQTQPGGPRPALLELLHSIALL